MRLVRLMPKLAAALEGIHDELFREALVLGLKRSTIKVHSGPQNTALQTWLAEQDLRGMGPGLVDEFDAIQTLSFPYFSRFPWRNPNITSDMDIGFMRKCKNLEMFTLYFVEREIFEQVPHPKPASTLRRQHHLDEMLQLSSLETLRIAVPIHLDYWEYDDVHELAAWFKDEFAKLGREVDAVAGAWEIPKAE